MSPFTPQDPSPRRTQHDHAPPPLFNLGDKQRHIPSSASNFPIITHQDSRPSRSPSTSTPVQQSLERTPQSYLPIRHDRRRPSSTKRLRQHSAPDTTAKIGANISNDGSIRTPLSQNNRIPSPCGKRCYSSPGWLKKHEDSCTVCRNINSTETSPEEVICCTPLASKRQAPPESEEPCATKVGEGHLGGDGWSPLSVNREAPKNLGPDRDQVPSLHGIEDQPDAVYATTFGLEDECNPEGSLVTNSAKVDVNAKELHSKIRAVLERGLTPNDSGGYIYIFSDPNRPEIHKIGRSKEPIRRMGQLQEQCGLTLGLVKDVYVDHYAQAERLIQTYLLDLRRPYRCEVCGASHGEWFQITAEFASEAVGRWTSFMTKEAPYDPETRQLRSFSRDLVKRRDHLLADVTPKVEAAREHWDRILSPTFLDRFRFEFNVVWELLWKFYWQINTMFAWTVAFIASRHPATFLIMAASVIGTFISISDEHHRLRNQSNRSKRKSI